MTDELVQNEDTLFQNEQIILGLVLRHGKEAAVEALPDLTHNRFIYDRRGELGADHQKIWQGITLAHADRVEPNIANVISYLGDTTLQEYLQSLVGSLSGYYGIYDLDVAGFRKRCEQADAAGVIYSVLAAEYRDARVLENKSKFVDFVRGIEDVDAWLANRTTRLGGIVRDTNVTGYRHISVYKEQDMRKLDLIKSGEQPMLLQTGIGPVDAWGLNVYGYLMVVHGRSSAGKSNLVHALDLGTAIGLVVNDIKGCVAVNSLEMLGADLAERWASMLSGYDLYRMKQGPAELVGEDFDRFMYWMEIVSQLPIYIDESDLLTTNVMDYRASELYSGDKGPIWRLSTDFIELFDDDEATMEQTMASIIKKHKSIARNLGIHVTAISQSTEGATGRFNPSRIAGPDGTRYSRAIRNAADIIVEVWNPIYMKSANINFEVPYNLDDQHVWVLVQKYRHGGKTGEFPLGWEPKYTQFFDPDYNSGMEQNAIFSHLTELEETLNIGKRPVVDPKDTTLGEHYGF